MDPELKASLSACSTASVASALLKLGLRNVWLRGVRPIAGAATLRVGTAFTMRFLPLREDLGGDGGLKLPTSREAIEAIERGSFAVIEARGVTDAGVAGDVLCARMESRGVAGLVTDGAIRDVAGVELTGLPVWAGGTASPAPGNSLTFADWGLPVACGGAAVFPGDIIAADRDGAIVIPAHMAERVAAEAAEIDRFDAWVITKVQAGEPLPGLYPPHAENLARYRRETGQGS